MSELVERLKQNARWQRDYGNLSGSAVVREAADRIETLEAALEHCSGAHHCDKAAAALTEEVHDVERDAMTRCWP